MKGLVICSIVALLLVAGCARPTTTTTTQPGATTTIPPAQGRAVFSMADAAADMGAVTAVKVTVDKVSVQSAAQGWVTVSSAPQTYDLLQLKADSKQALLADAQLQQGTYNQLRLDISKVVVTDAQGDHEAKLPSGELKIVGDLVVAANSTSFANFDFHANESLHVTGNGKYIMAPVVQIETRDHANVTIAADKRVVVRGGSVRANLTVGMDAQGNVGAGIRIPVDANLTDVGITTGLTGTIGL